MPWPQSSWRFCPWVAGTGSVVDGAELCPLDGSHLMAIILRCVSQVDQRWTTASHSWSTCGQRVKTQAPSDFWSFCILFAINNPYYERYLLCSVFAYIQDEHLNKEQRFEETPGVFHPDAWYINGRGHFTKILFKIQYSRIATGAACTEWCHQRPWQPAQTHAGSTPQAMPRKCVYWFTLRFGAYPIN